MKKVIVEVTVSLVAGLILVLEWTRVLDGDHSRAFKIFWSVVAAVAFVLTAVIGRALLSRQRRPSS